MTLPIEILIYTDDPTRVNEDGPLGIRDLRRQIDAHQPAFARINITLVSRNSDAEHHADHLLNEELARKDYDQVWFFGIHQINKTSFTLGIPGGGGPRSELEKSETDDLSVRMSINADPRGIGLGVLIAGDHANPPPTMLLPSGPTKLCPPNVDHETFLGLGRALGKHVLRGGELRKWEGPPTHCTEDSFNTQYLPHGGDLSDPSNQHDFDPQPLKLATFDLQGNESPMGQPHKLFMGRDGKWIEVLPDHDHEGAVQLPKSFPIDKWPRSQYVQPKPQIIARGMDRRRGKPLNILAAYDGDAANAGRIISDSSWHHYFNINLKNLSADMPQSPEADQIGQFFSNLAIWLAPRQKRRAMGVEMVHWLANHPMMIEYAASGALNIGRFALSQALAVATGCEVQELLIALAPDGLRESAKNIIFKPPNVQSPLPSMELLLGSILHEYFVVIARGEKVPRDLSDVLQRGFEHSFWLNTQAHVELATDSLSWLLPFVGDSQSSATRAALAALGGPEFNVLVTTERRTGMEPEQREDWFYSLRLDKNGDEESFTLTLFSNPAHCLPIGPHGMRLCRLRGKLVASPREEYTVVGTRLFTPQGFVMSLEFRFRRVRMMATGVETGDGFTSRFIAHDVNNKEVNAERLTARIDPDSGDTGTGTGTQTLLAE